MSCTTIVHGGVAATSIGSVMSQKFRQVVLAPMSGITDAPFRRLVRRFGVDLVVSEMIAARAVLQRNRETERMLDLSTDEPPVAMQLVGGEPGAMAEAARILADRGVAAIDINMGCPVRKVVATQSGSALMRDETRAAAIVGAVVRAAGSVPVTVKMRTGWDSTERNAPRLARIVEVEGASGVTVHGRTRAQHYSGRADWRFIEEVSRAVRIPVIGNGDVASPEDAVRMLEESGTAGVMIGRAALGRPWLPGQVARFLKTGVAPPPPPLSVQRDVLLEHFESSLIRYGSYGGVRMMRKHIGWYVSGLPGAAAFRGGINAVSDPEGVRQAIDRFYANHLDPLAA
ncbi:MAG: tRNA dihydrouridine synthase DusB [Alphaproteobacteria bacterium]